MNNAQMERYGDLLFDYMQAHYKEMFREPSGKLTYKFIVPGSGYSNSLWDWDSWLTNIALDEVVENEDISEYEKGCVLNFLTHIDSEGRMPIFITPTGTFPNFSKIQSTNIHKPVLAQHALFISKKNADFQWLKEYFFAFEKYLLYYKNYCLHKTGLYYWIDDCAIGVDNDPCTYFRPRCSSASIYLNCLMYKELLALQEIAKALALDEEATKYFNEAENLKAAIQTHCWDERDGFFYSVDLNLLPIDKNQTLHSGGVRHWDCLIQRIGVWSGFMAMWAGIATKEQAERMVREHYRNEATFNAPYGVRSLSKMEKMYSIRAMNNPSCWLGPIWGIVNYMVFEGLKTYGYTEDAKELAVKTVKLYGEDLEKTGTLHEYYHPETGEGLYNPGFQNWNLLSYKMWKWYIKN